LWFIFSKINMILIRASADDRVLYACSSLELCQYPAISQVTVWSLKFIIIPDYPRSALPGPVIISYVLNDSKRSSI
jgi:hypothetical protein